MLFLAISPYMPTFTEQVKPPGECAQMPCIVRSLGRNPFVQHVQPQLTLALPGNDLEIQLLRGKVKWFFIAWEEMVPWESIFKKKYPRMG
jgi:hypothetical protein